MVLNIVIPCFHGLCVPAMDGCRQAPTESVCQRVYMYVCVACQLLYCNIRIMCWPHRCTLITEVHITSCDFCVCVC